MIFQNMYVRRHDRIVNHVYHQINSIRPELIVHVNNFVTADMLNSHSNAVYNSIQHRRPDLLILDHHNRKAFIVEVSTPFDAFVEQCYHTKFDYYQPLCELISVDTVYSCKIVVLIIGATGCMHERVVPGLKMLGISTFKSKAIAKYLSISAAIGSKLIWQMRVKAASAQA
jgi:hypothetical protein